MRIPPENTFRWLWGVSELLPVSPSQDPVTPALLLLQVTPSGSPAFRRPPRGTWMMSSSPCTPPWRSLRRSFWDSWLMTTPRRYHPLRPLRGDFSLQGGVPEGGAGQCIPGDLVLSLPFFPGLFAPEVVHQGGLGGSLPCRGRAPYKSRSLCRLPQQGR